GHGPGVNGTHRVVAAADDGHSPLEKPGGQAHGCRPVTLAVEPARPDHRERQRVRLDGPPEKPLTFNLAPGVRIPDPDVLTEWGGLVDRLNPKGRVSHRASKRGCKKEATPRV